MTENSMEGGEPLDKEDAQPDAALDEDEEEGGGDPMDYSDGEGEADDDDEDYEYTYDDDEDGDGGGLVPTTRGPSSCVFTGLDTIGCVNDMLLKKELTRIKSDVEKTKEWQVDLTWQEEERSLGVMMTHEGYMKANLILTFPKTYPNEPPKFTFLGPRYDDTVDFILGADIFEPTRKGNWNDTFTCTNLLMIVTELVKGIYPITDELVFDEYENTLISICRTRLPGIPKRVKEGMVYFGVRIEPQEKTGGKRSSGVGYSNGGRESHDFSLHDLKFKEQLEGLKKFLEMSEQADSIKLARIAHIDFTAWLLQYLEEELPIFKFEEVHELVKSSLELVRRVDPKNEHLEAVQEVFQEREALLSPADGKLLTTSTDHVIAHADEFEFHQFKNDATAPPSIEVVKRIMLELENLKDFLRGMTDGQIFVVFSEATCLLWKVLMIPSSGTPYYGGCFEFHLAIPPDYPARPPKCLFMTTGGNQVRYNPNLYNSGKVCLSLLGTWSGEPWDPAHSNLSQLLISILAFIFTTEPLKNEPGLEASTEKAVNFYNAYIRLETVETAMIGMMENPPPEFAEVIKNQMKKAWSSLIQPDLVQWGDKHEFEENDATINSGSGQILRLAWFRSVAIGSGKYKKAMEAACARVQALVDKVSNDGAKEGATTRRSERRRAAAAAASSSGSSSSGGTGTGASESKSSKG